MNDEEGWLYIIHFDPAYKHARHYLGFTTLPDIRDRFHRHRQGGGARLVQVATAAGCGMTLYLIKRGTRTEERRLKRLSSYGKRFCPLCQGLEIRPALSVPAAQGQAEQAG